MKQKNPLLLTITFIFLSTFSVKSQDFLYSFADVKKIPTKKEWVDSLMQNMTQKEKIGQLFMVAAYSNKGIKHKKHLEQLIKKYHIGGLIFFQGGPVRQARMTNHLQSVSKYPLMVGMDAEWGLSMRLDSTMQFPRQMTLGAIQDTHLIYNMGKEIARQCKRLGVHINFAPVVDINNNADNPVIGSRSFGEDKKSVAKNGIAYMKGLQENGIMACAKHFPGHGDTDADSHHSLPVINHSKDRLKKIELYPFRRLIDRGLKSIMVAHLHVPALDSTPNLATTLSDKVVNELLRKKMGYKGLVFTDALNMKGVSKYYEPGKVDLKALQAGNDVLLFPEDVPKAVSEIHKALENNNINNERFNKHVKRILAAKYEAGLYNWDSVKTKNLHNDLHSGKAKSIRQKLYEKALTVVSNKDKKIPVKYLQGNEFASLSIGAPKNNFQDMLSRYANIDHYSIPNSFSSSSTYDQTMKEISKYDKVFVGIHDINSKKRENFNISVQTKEFLNTLQQKTDVITVVFGSPYSLQMFSDLNHMICAYEDNKTTRKVAAQLIFGAIDGEGSLPVTASPAFPAGHGIITRDLKRLKFGYPEETGLNSKILNKLVDSLVMEGIKEKAMPGCQVLIAKNGSVIYDKNFGHYTYEKKKPVTHQTVYDLASLTKVAATTQVIMFLHGWGVLDINKKASCYLPELIGTNKEDLIIRDILVHQAGLIPYIMHWKKTMNSRGLKDYYYCKEKDDRYCNPVTPYIYTAPFLEDSIWHWTIESKLRTPKPDSGCYDYKYSDLSFYIMKRIVEKIINQPIENFLEQNFYKPLGTTTLTYKPMENGLKKERMAPTEVDNYFRFTTIQGTVHDQGAAMCGGVAGHAGLFSNAIDLAKLMQMNLQNGKYGGIKYLPDSSLHEFTRKQMTNNRRALGWDRPFYEGEKILASEETFGHTGFTGTCTFVDPRYNIVYVFLSNRTYPEASNHKIVTMSIRTKILNAIYRSMGIT